MKLVMQKWSLLQMWIISQLYYLSKLFQYDLFFFNISQPLDIHGSQTMNPDDLGDPFWMDLADLSELQ